MSNFFTEIERHIWEKSVIYRGVIEEKRQLQKAVLKRLIWWGFTVFTILDKEMGFWRLINIYWKSESWEYKKEKEENFLAFLFSVPGAGIEPARVLPHRFLRPTRLPIPPPGQMRVQKYNFFLHVQSIILKKIQPFFSFQKLIF